jgi:hypothetical protein
MLRRTAIIILLFAIVACATGAWLAFRSVTSAFVAPGAANVRVIEIRPGQREISYTMPNPADGWQTAVSRRLNQSGWQLETDPFQWGGTETITTLASYVRTSRFGFVTIRERAELLGDRSSALIKVSYTFSTQRLF